MTTYNSNSVINNNNSYTAYFPLQIYESNSTSNFYPARRRQMSGNSRTRQMLLANQSVLNNLVSLNSLNPSTNRSHDPAGGTETHRSSSNSSKSFLIKKPFKHFNQQSNETSSSSIKSSNHLHSDKSDKQSESKVSTNPSTSLILSTAKDVNQFVDSYERERLLNQVEMSNRRVVYLRKPPNSSKYSGLKPLDYQGRPTQGPNIQNCIGIKNEPKGKKGSELRELYEYKLKLLKMKYDGRDILNQQEMWHDDRAVSRSLSTPNQQF